MWQPWRLLQRYEITRNPISPCFTISPSPYIWHLSQSFVLLALSRRNESKFTRCTRVRTRTQYLHQSVTHSQRISFDIARVRCATSVCVTFESTFFRRKCFGRSRHALEFGASTINLMIVIMIVVNNSEIYRTISTERNRITNIISNWTIRRSRRLIKSA